MEWLSLMQHHGAPTRLLDFTYSIYVAAYFAVEAAADDKACAIWAIRGPWAMHGSRELLKSGGKNTDDVDRMPELLWDDDESFIERLCRERPDVSCTWPVNAYRLNERLRIQQGTFLTTGNVSIPFMDNLTALSGYDDKTNLVKIIVPPALRKKVITDLFSMHISRTSLFPGLDGFAQSLGVYSSIYNPIDWKKS